MVGFWMCFSFLTSILVIPSVQNIDISAKAASEIEELYDSFAQISAKTASELGELHESVAQISAKTASELGELPESVAQEKYAVYLNEGKGNCGDCGFSPSFTRTIVDGTIVEPPNRFPWMVALYVNGQHSKHCGGAIISEDFILTAAHCLKKRQIASRVNKTTCAFKSGRNESCFLNRDQMKISFLTKTYDMTADREVAEIIPHPAYEPQESTVRNDIGLIRMSKAIKCNEYANPICLPSSFVPVEVGMIVGVAGWGATKNIKERDGKQRGTKIEVQHPNVCSHIKEFSTKYAICLSGNGRSGPCFGDSGGPAFYQTKGKFYVMGVAAAHTSITCETDSPVIYTSVAKNIDWIKKTSGVDVKNPHDK